MGDFCKAFHYAELMKAQLRFSFKECSLGKTLKRMVTRVFLGPRRKRHPKILALSADVAHDSNYAIRHVLIGSRFVSR